MCRNADLKNASFSNADLTEVKFVEAKLNGADFTNASMAAVVLNGASVKGVKWAGAKNNIPGFLGMTMGTSSSTHKVTGSKVKNECEFDVFHLPKRKNQCAKESGSCFRCDVQGPIFPERIYFLAAIDDTGRVATRICNFNSYLVYRWRCLTYPRSFFPI